MSRAYVAQRLSQIASEMASEIARGQQRKKVAPRRQPPQPLRYKHPRVILPITARVKKDADVWIPPELPLLTLDELLELSAIGGNARRPGVYFLFMREQLNYIGSSLNVRGRVCGHDLYREVEFNKATYLPIPWPWYLAVEALYIQRYRPGMNSTYRDRK